MKLRRSLRSACAIGLGTAAMLAVLPAATAGEENRSGGRSGLRSSTVAVYGDSPYGTSNADTAQFAKTPAFIDTINADPNVGLVLQVGDIHSGKQYCTQAYDQSIRDFWDSASPSSFQDPLVYTPGDNEWADCHKLKQGGDVFVNGSPVDYANGDPVANLALIRSLFFPQPGVTLGAHKKFVLSQAFAYDRRYPSDAQFVENVAWVQSGVLFVNINVPGGSNNDQDIWYAAQRGLTTESAAQTKERTERTGADLRWLDTAFGLAKLFQMKGVVITTQADMWDPDGQVNHVGGYEPFVQSVASHTTDFAKPVLMFNGDSHFYRSDNPLQPSASCAGEVGACTADAWLNHPGYNVGNFHRVVVHGSTAPMEWLKLTIDPSSNAPAGANAFGPFSWERKTQALP